MTANAALPAAVAVLRAAYPRQDFPDDTIRVYVRMLSDVEADAVVAAIEHLVKTSRFLPSVAEIRETVALTALGLPSAGEAWEMVQDPGSSSHEWPGVLISTVRAAGGRFSIRMTENPTTMRAQFTKDYLDRVQRLVQSTAAGHGAAPALPPAPPAHALPPTTRMPLRPVLRWVGDGMPEPVDDVTKHDAILALRDLPDDDMVRQAAERVFLVSGR